jgi:hypothetical protein
VQRTAVNITAVQPVNTEVKKGGPLSLLVVPLLLSAVGRLRQIGTKAALSTNQGYHATTRSQSIRLTPYSLAEDCRIRGDNRVFGNEGPPIKADENS